MYFDNIFKINHQEKMNFEKIANILIFRPSFKVEMQIRYESEKHLREKYSPGIYKNKKIINEFLMHQYSFYNNKFNEIFPKIASLDLLMFLLDQYDKSVKIEEKFKECKLSDAECKKWDLIGSKFRRGIKYFAEKLVMLAQYDPLVKTNNLLLLNLNIAWICVEQLVEYYTLSDQTFYIFPNNTILEVLPEGEKNYFDLSINNYNCKIFFERVKIERLNRHKFISDSQFFYDSNTFKNFLDELFKTTLGFTYSNLVEVLNYIIDNSRADPESFQIPFLPLEKLINIISNEFKISENSIKILISGFTVIKSNLEKEKREIFKPKQWHRAYSRGFFEFPHKTGNHLIFSKEMAKESFIQLMFGIAFKKIPPEWKNNKTSLAVNNLSYELSKKFENEVYKIFNKISIKGIKTLKKYFYNNEWIDLPPIIGEIDFIGYYSKENILIIAEFKLVHYSTEPKYFYDDIEKFVNNKKSFVVKFNKKINWLIENRHFIIDTLKKNGIIFNKTPKILSSVMITYFPAVASDFIKEFPCIALTEFMLDFNKNKKWPYKKGIYHLD